MSKVKALYGLLLIALIAIVEVAGHLILTSHHGYSSLRKVLLTNASNDQLPRLSSHPYLNYFPTPHFSIDGVQQHNEHGYRGSKVSLRKPDQVFRILFLGGSTTYSYFTNQPDSTLPEQVRSILRQECQTFSDVRLEVMNGGLPSGTSAELLTHYLFKYRYYEPDLVVIHAGGNDAIGNAVAGPYQPDLSHFRKTFVGPEPPPNPVRWMLQSRLLSLFIIRGFYHEYTDGDHFGHTGSALTCRWFAPPLSDQNSQRYDAFYQNIATLIRAVSEDGGVTVLVPFIANESFIRNQWPGVADDYISGISRNRISLIELSSEAEVYFCDLKGSDISSDAWLDDCHLTTGGITEKAAVISNSICTTAQNGKE